MGKEDLVRKELDSLLKSRGGWAALIGSAIFLLFSPLDFISTPEHFQLFFWYRLAMSAVLLVLAVLVKKAGDPGTVRILLFTGVALSAITIEVMILHFGGHTSSYYAGMVLLSIVVLVLLPAGPWFHASMAATVYAVYLIPILLLDEITHPRIFITNNYFFLFIVGACLLARRFNMQSLESAIGLARDLARYQSELEDFATLRNLELSEKMGQLEKENARRAIMEKALLQSSNEWRATVDSTSEMLILVDEEGKIIKTNMATANFTGKPILDLLGSSVFTLFREEDLPGRDHPFTRMQDSGGRAFQEFVVRPSEKWYFMSAEPISEAFEPYHGGVIIVRDITQVKVMEQALIEARDEWEETFELIQDGISIHDQDFRIIRANTAAKKLLGESAPEGRHCYELFHGMDEPVEGCPTCASKLTGKSSTVDLYEPTLDRYLEVTCLPRPGGVSAGTIHVVSDITERKEAIEALNSAASRMETILDRAPFGIFIVNGSGTVEYANPAMLSLTGFERSQFVGANMNDLPGCAPLKMGEKIVAALEGDPFRFGPDEYHCHTRENKSFANFIGVPLEEQGKRKVLIFLEDLSELMEAEEERKQLHTILLQTQKMESIGNLASGIAHDFNNLLLAVMGFSDAAAEKLPADHPAQADLETVIGASERGADLVNQLLAYARQQDLAIKSIDINDIVSRSAGMLSRMLPRTVTIDVDTSKAPCTVMGDPVQIEQVLFNLALNARDAMPGGGTLGLKTLRTAVAKEEQTQKTMPPGEYVTIAVTDSGTGMEKEVLDRIFEPFFTTKRDQGTGLGLATAYGIVAQHGGILKAASSPGAGSTFALSLPFVRESTRVEPEAASPCVEAVTLLVDDMEATRKVIAGKLEEAGCRVITASRGEEASLLLEKEKGGIDLLLCDMVLPDESGPALAEKCRLSHPSLEVVFMSGHPEESPYRDSMLKKGETVLFKSIGADEIARRVCRLLHSREV